MAAVLEHTTGELCPIVGDDPVWNPEPAHDGLDKFDCRSLVNIDHRCYLWPFGELIDCDVQVTVPADGFWEWSQDIHPPYGEWPRGWNDLQRLNRCVDLPGMKLACLASPY